MLGKESMSKQIRVPVGGHAAIARADVEGSVSRRVSCGQPQPTPRGLFNLGPESLLVTRKCFAPRKGIPMTVPSHVMASTKPSCSVRLLTSFNFTSVHEDMVAQQMRSYNVREVE